MRNPSLFLLILGMHRSGTSCLAGALESSGLYLGDVRRTGVYNKKGYFEIRELQQLHDKILELNEASWDNPKPVYDVGIYGGQIEEIVKELSKKEYCGVKDPRVLLLLDYWQKITGERFQLVGTFRHPMAVAQSLFERNGIPISEGLDLWIKYNDILVESHKKKPFPIVHFDLSEKDKYINDIQHIASYFGLNPKKWKLRLFISKKLQHHKYSIDDIPENCEYLYKYLLANQYGYN
ncbi:MAG: hypothetical protein JST82_14290 [Bacteroidetes bacterium]|nr:hypothetical protein [Bacteroidota bacterium]